MGDIERALEVHVDDLLDRLGIQLGEVAVGADAGVRDQHVEASESLDHGVDGLLYLGAVAHVARHRERLR